MEPAAQYALAKYPYPGNIRELENIIEHAIVLSEGGILRLEDLPENVQEEAREKTVAIPHIKEDVPETRLLANAENNRVDAPAKTEGEPANADEILSLEEVERRHILHALSVCKNNKTEVCKRLGISRATLWRKLKELQIQMDGDE